MLQRRKCECGAVWSSLLHHVQSLRQQENQHYDDDQGPYSHHRLCGLYILRKHTDSVPLILVKLLLLFFSVNSHPHLFITLNSDIINWKFTLSYKNIRPEFTKWTLTIQDNDHQTISIHQILLLITIEKTKPTKHKWNP